MNKVAILLLFGIGLIVTGAFWMLFENGLISGLIGKYWISTPYMDLMGVGWNVLPIIILIVGVLAVIFAGIGSSGGRVMVVE